MKPNRAAIRDWYSALTQTSREHIRLAAERIIHAKQHGGRVVVVTGSGPNIHEGVTTLIAELMHKNVVDGVITSSAIVAHEMAGTLDRVKSVKVTRDLSLGLDDTILPRGRIFEATVLSDPQRDELQKEIGNGWDLYDRVMAGPGSVLLKAAGNMAWPMGPRTESLAREAEILARQAGSTVEQIAGFGADPRTMIGAGALRNIPVLVSVPQLVGGGDVGLSVGDAVSITRRCQLIAQLLSSADVIIESAIALAQEIHDGPFELYTGHGIWAAWRHKPTYSLEHKSLIRIDLDPNLEVAWHLERQSSKVQDAVNQGLPKTKLTGMPFRMEMSGFARLEGSIPITADIGIVWPSLAAEIEDALGIDLDFISAPQESPEGQRMRQWIAETIRFVDRESMYASVPSVAAARQARSQVASGSSLHDKELLHERRNSATAGDAVSRNKLHEAIKKPR